MNEDKIEKAPNVPAFVRFVASTIPMVFDDSMSYYEALANLVHYIQDTVDVVNNILISTCNINKEFNRPNETFTIESAAALVPANRRSNGLCIKFLTSDGCYSEYSYMSENVSNVSWVDPDNWKLNIRILDGGTW